MAIMPRSSKSCRTVVSGGYMLLTPGMSSKPVTLMSSGTRTPCSCSARITPIAITSFEQTAHVGSRPPLEPMLSRIWFIRRYASADSQSPHCTVTEFTLFSAHSLFHASRRVWASRHWLGPAKNSTLRWPYLRISRITEAMPPHWSTPTSDTRRWRRALSMRMPSPTLTPPCVDVMITHGCVTFARHATWNISSVGVRKMNASTPCCMNMPHRSSNSDCVHSASWTIATETNIVWARAVASIDDSAVTGP